MICALTINIGIQMQHLHGLRHWKNVAVFDCSTKVSRPYEEWGRSGQYVFGKRLLDYYRGKLFCSKEDEVIAFKMVIYKTSHYLGALIWVVCNIEDVGAKKLYIKCCMYLIFCLRGKNCGVCHPLRSMLSIIALSIYQRLLLLRWDENKGDELELVGFLRLALQRTTRFYYCSSLQ